MTSDRYAGQPIAAVFPHLAGRPLPTLAKIEDADPGALDVVFGCLPHGTTQDVIRELPRGPKVIDLSADFRLHDPRCTSAPTASRTGRWSASRTRPTG